MGNDGASWACTEGETLPAIDVGIHRERQDLWVDLLA